MQQISYLTEDSTTQRPYRCAYCFKENGVEQLLCGHSFCLECTYLIYGFLHCCPSCDTPLRFCERCDAFPPLYYNTDDCRMLFNMEIEALQSSGFSLNYSRQGNEIVVSDRDSDVFVRRKFHNAYRNCVVHPILAPVDYTRYPICGQQNSALAVTKAIDFGRFGLLEDGTCTVFDENIASFSNADMDLVQLSCFIRLKQDITDYCVTDVMHGFYARYYIVSPIIRKDGILSLDFAEYRVVHDYDIAEVLYPANAQIGMIQQALGQHFKISQQLVLENTRKLDAHYRACDVAVCLANAIKNDLKLDALFSIIYQLCNILYGHGFATLEIYNDNSYLQLQAVNAYNFTTNATVIRGQDWEYDNQDVGFGETVVLNNVKHHIGRLVYLHRGQYIALVYWGNGTLYNYRVGFYDKYDLRYYNKCAPQSLLTESTVISIEAFRKHLQAYKQKCLCNRTAYDRFLASNLSLKQRSVIYAALLYEGEFLQYFKEPNFDFFADVGNSKPKCCLDYVDYDTFTLDNMMQFWRYVEQGRKFQPMRRCSYDEIHFVNERVAHYGEVKRRVADVNRFMLIHATIPLHASSARLRLPIGVTVGPDWHHGRNFGTKIGILLPHARVQNACQVCVVWIADVKRSILFQQMQAQFAKLIRSGRAQQHDPPEYGEFYAYTYDAGRQNLFEISAYYNLVTPDNFRTGRLVAPAVDWQLDTGQLVGMLVWRQAGWATVIWLDCSINRHKIGSGSVFELTYVEYE